MTRFILRRLGILVLTLAIASFATYGALYLAPGSPVDFLLGNRPATAEQRAALTSQLGLDKPFLERYLSWLGGMLHGDFGTSIQQGQPVSDLIKAALPTTLLLVCLTFVLVVVLGVALGSIAALRGRRVDDGIGTLMNVSIATPPFVASLMLTSLFAVRLGWFPVFGQGDGFADRLQHLTLPAAALAIGWWPVVGSVTRTSMREEAGGEHVETAISRGLPRGRVMRRHVLRNALVPIVTAAGLAIAGLIAGTALVESTFQLNGLGGLLVRSVTQKDFAVAQAVAMIMVAAFALINLVADVLAALLDPRVREGWSA